MTEPDLALGVEWAILELMCLDLENEARQKTFVELMSSGQVHWGELLEQALNHKVLPLLAFHTRTGILRDIVPWFLWLHMQTTLELNRHKTAIYRQAAAEIVNALDSYGVRFVATKGIAFESTLYEGNGTRNFKTDIDFMVAPKDKDIVINALQQLGYEMGDFSWSSGTIRPHRREDMIIYQLHPDHIPIMSKLTGDPLVKSISIDFATSLTWAESPYQVPIEVALADICRQPIPGHPDTFLPVFSPFFQFGFTILHLFREAWFEKWLKVGQDVNLSKFIDVIRLWQYCVSHEYHSSFVAQMEKFSITAPLLWVLEHIDRTWHTTTVSTLDMKNRIDESFLFSLNASDGEWRHWQGTMRERLHCKERKTLLEGSMSAS